MDGFRNQAVGGFEDQIRGMLQGSASSVPTVRLPPASNRSTRVPGPSPLNEAHYTQPAYNTPPAGPAYLRNAQSQQVGHPPIAPVHAQRPAGYQQYRTLDRPQTIYQQDYQRGHQSLSRAPRGGPAPRARHSQQVELDPNAFNRGRPAPHDVRAASGARNLYDPTVRSPVSHGAGHGFRERQAQYLDEVVAAEVPNVTMSEAERHEKDTFSQALQSLCHEVCKENPDLPKVSLECFGSFRSGFASAGSDMDLVIVVQDQSMDKSVFSLLEDDLPRALEKKLLQKGYGARLLSRTRVPIIKICQSPGDSLLDRLREEREKWDFLPKEKKYPHLFQPAQDESLESVPVVDGLDTARSTENARDHEENQVASIPDVELDGALQPRWHQESKPAPDNDAAEVIQESDVQGNGTDQSRDPSQNKQKMEQSRTWTRERKAGPLDFPKDGVGVQCDINFFNPLGLHNTQMLRCYSVCDPRVKPMILFVKAWAKLRRINSSYSGTLSSYGYVLMVIHYLVNITKPAVLPNLQLPWRANGKCTPPGATRTEVDGWTVDFWRDEDEIQAALRNGEMSTNTESLGSLLAGFFQYYSSMGNGPQFVWTQCALSLRTPGGIVRKDEKGWVKAITEEGEGKKIQHRYLFCIEDPFELSHNVARTVTHNGIVAIRDEFRRAYRILCAKGQGRHCHEGELFAPLVETQDMIHATAAMKLSPNPQHPMTTGSAPSQTKKPAPVPSEPRKFNGGVVDSTRSSQGRVAVNTLDVSDQEAFPTLGAASTTKSRSKKSNDVNASSISGDKAQAYLEEYRRKRAEAQAEHTAMGAAEAVLDGTD